MVSSAWPGVVNGEAARMLSLAQATPASGAAGLSGFAPLNVTPIAPIMGTWNWQNFAFVDFNLPPVILPGGSWPGFTGLETTPWPPFAGFQAYGYTPSRIWPSAQSPGFATADTGYWSVQFRRDAFASHGTTNSEYAVLGTIRFKILSNIGLVTNNGGALSISSGQYNTTALWGESVLGTGSFDPAIYMPPNGSDTRLWGNFAQIEEVIGFGRAVNSAIDQGSGAFAAVALNVGIGLSTSYQGTQNPYADAGAGGINVRMVPMARVFSDWDLVRYGTNTLGTTAQQTPIGYNRMHFVQMELTLEGLFNTIHIPTVPVEFFGSIVSWPLVTFELQGQLVRMASPASADDRLI